MSSRTLTEKEQTRLKDRWKMCVAAESEQRTLELADLEFEAGEHWDPAVKSAREKAGKPCLTYDLMSGTIKQVTNQARSARPGIVVTPRGNGANKDSAQLWQAILRRIETNSNADFAYTWANQHQVKMGRGSWRILPYYISDESDEQDLKIEWIDNQHSVYLDPSRKEPDGSDKKFAFIVDDLTVDDYKDRFGDSSLAANLGSFTSLGDGPPDWITKTRVRVAEYMEIKESTRDRYSLSDGTYVFDEFLKRKPPGRDKGKFAKGEPILPKGVKILRTRQIPTRTISWMLTNGVEALEETTIPGHFIPIVEIEGERRNINGKVDRRGMVRTAKSPQIMTNYLESTVVQVIATGTKSRWLIAEGQTEGHEEMWRTSSTKDWDALVYKETTVGGTVVSPPIPIDREPPIQATVEAAQRSAMQLRAILGYVDVMAQEQGPTGSAVSGRAINARKLQQEMQSSDYMDGLGRGIRLTAKILHSMARELYDTPRLMRIKGVDEKELEIVTHLGPDQQAQAQQMMTNEVKHLLDLAAGDYDFAFSPGKSYQSQRQEANDAMGQLFTAAPDLAHVGADIWVASMDWPGANKLAERLKKANPLAQDDQNQQPIPPQAKQRMEQLDQYAQMAHTQIEQLNSIISTKKLELDSKEKIAAEDNATKIEIEQIKAGIAQAQNELKAALEEKADLIQLLHETRLQHQEHAHEAGMAALSAHHETVAAAQQPKKVTFTKGADGAVTGAIIAPHTNGSGAGASE